MVTLSFSRMHRRDHMAVTLKPHNTGTEIFSNIDRYAAADNNLQRTGPARGKERKRDCYRKSDHEHSDKKRRRKDRDESRLCREVTAEDYEDRGA